MGKDYYDYAHEASIQNSQKLVKEGALDPQAASHTAGTPEYLARVTSEAKAAQTSYRNTGYNSPKPFAKDEHTAVKHGTVYVIQDIGTGLYKIGRTTDMDRRMRELGVGKSARLIASKRVGDAPAVERAAHQRYRANRLPQTEYFRLSGPPVI
jgi:hypothetical protein